eukprot:429624-Amphidinium_carterae.3
MSEYDFLDVVSPDKVWKMRFWSLEDTERPLTTWRCRFVTVVLEKDITLQLWPVHCKRKRAASKRKSTATAWDTMGVSIPAEVPEPTADDDEDMPDNESEGLEDDISEAADEEDEATTLLDLLAEASVAESVPLEVTFAADLKAEADQGHLVAEDLLHVQEAESTARGSTDPPPRTLQANDAAGSDTGAATAAVAIASQAPSSARRSAPLRGIVGTASASWHCKYGKISYYVSKQAFEAQCTLPCHCGGPRCVITRGNRLKAVKGGQKGGGRPLGFLVAWLQAAESHSSRDNHRCPSNMFFLFEDRKAARAELMKSAVGLALG